jgi:hypothetical protein
MKYLELIIRRHNLRSAARMKPAGQVHYYDLSCTMQDVALAHRVVFIDDDGSERILKNKEVVGEPLRIERPLTPASFRSEIEPYLQKLEDTLKEARASH